MLILIILTSLIVSALITSMLAAFMESIDIHLEIKTICVMSIVLFLIMLIPSAIYFLGFHYNTGAGDHFGYITSTETNGIIFKTDRVYFKTSIRSSQEDKYCVINSKVFNGLKKLNSNDQIKIKYVSYYSNGLASCDGENAVITGFTKIEEKQ